MEIGLTLRPEGRNTFYAETLNRLLRDWRGWGMDIYERDFLVYLMLETVAKDRPALRASLKDLEFGVSKHAKGDENAGLLSVGMSRAKLCAVIKALKECDAIRVTPGTHEGQKSMYSVNLNWNRGLEP